MHLLIPDRMFAKNQSIEIELFKKDLVAENVPDATGRDNSE